MDNSRIREAAGKTLNNLKIALPIVLGVFMFISFFNPLLNRYYPSMFTGNYLIDPLIGAVGGSLFFGIPITSYIAGGKLLAEGVSLLAITAFILAWTTVGVAMLPMEISFLGRRFAISRNILNFIFSLAIAVLTIVTLKVIA